MKAYHLVPLGLLAACLTGCVGVSGWRTVSGSGNVTTESRAIRSFDRVSVSGVGDLAIVQGNEESLTIETDDNLLPLIRSEVHNGRLSLGPDNVNVRPSRGIHYRLMVRDLREVNLSGALRAEADTLKTDRLNLSISGSGKIEIGQLEAQSLSARISGSGDTVVGGHVARQELNISGSGNHRANSLRSTDAELRISGSGHARVWVEGSLEAHISGSGRVEYRGHPEVDTHISGSGRVRRMAAGE